MKITHWLGVGLLAFLGALSIAHGQQITTPSVTASGCAYNASPPTITTGNFALVQCDVNGKLIISGGGGGGPATIADGADVAEGSTTDAAATQGSTGTVSAKLRTITSQLNTIAAAVAAATPAGTNAIGSVGGFNANLSNAPTVQNAAYSASNAIGGLQTVAAFRNTTQPSGIVNYIQVISAGGSTQGMTIYGWTKTPAATCTDKVAYAANAADYPNSIPGFPVVLTPAVTQGTTASRASQSIVVSVKNTDTSPTANLYFCAVVNGSVTPATTTDLTFDYSIAQD